LGDPDGEVLDARFPGAAPLGYDVLAVPALRSAITAVGPDHPRNHGIYLARLAQALLAYGDLDEGVSIASTALCRSTQISSGRLRAQFAGIRKQLTPHADVPLVRDYLERSAALVSA